MIRITVADLCRATGARLISGDADLLVQGIETDSRAVEAGRCFVCFPGERVDGNDYAAAAARAGASCVVCTEELPAAARLAIEQTGCALVRAEGDDATEFLLRLAHEWRKRNPQWIVVGVTGSVGKTTTKDMLRCALAVRYRVHATQGNFNNLIGLPLTLLSASAEDECVVAEMGMNHKGELERLSQCALPTVALITNVGTSHIGNLGSREAIARAKAEILCGMSPTSHQAGVVPSCLVLTSDNDFADLIARDYAAPAGVELERVGSHPGDVVGARDISLDGQGCASFTLSFADGWSSAATLSTPGRHFVADVLLAMAIVDRLGVDRQQALDAICHMPSEHMRLEVVGGTDGHPRVIDDSYNASPSSMAAALDVLCQMNCSGRRIAVLGEIGELGQDAARLHGYVGAYAAAKPLDLLVLIGGDDAREMAEAALTMGFSEDRLERFDSVSAAVRTLAPILAADDLVLAKASRAAGLDRFVQGVLA